VLRAVARKRLTAGQGELDLGLDNAGSAGRDGPLPIRSSRMGHLCDALTHAYRVPGFEQTTGGDDVFRRLA